MEFPRVVKIRQKFPRPRVENVEEALREQLGRGEISSTIRPGMSVALTAGSRGIAEIDEIMRSLVEILKQMEAEPFIVPAMGSHGGATAEGQVEILDSLGVTEEFCGAPIRSSMEVVVIGETGGSVVTVMAVIETDSFLHGTGATRAGGRGLWRYPAPPRPRRSGRMGTCRCRGPDSNRGHSVRCPIFCQDFF